MITSAVFVSTMLLLGDALERLLLSSVVVAVGLAIPCWKFVAQTHKVLLRGPWDIPKPDSMQLGYQVGRSPSAPAAGEER